MSIQALAHSAAILDVSSNSNGAHVSLKDDAYLRIANANGTAEAKSADRTMVNVVNANVGT